MLINSSDCQVVTLEDVIGDDKFNLEDFVTKSNKSDVLKNSLKILTKKEKELIYLKYGILDDISRTSVEIALNNNCSTQNINYKLNRSLKKLKKYFTIHS